MLTLHACPALQPDKKEGRQHSAGQYYPMPYGFCPPQFWQPWPQAVPGMADGRAGQMMSMPQQYYQVLASSPPRSCLPLSISCL